MPTLTVKPSVNLPELILHDSPVDAVSDFQRTHLWLFDLDSINLPPAGGSPLSAEELRRTERFKTPLLQRRFVASRVFLRETLATVLSVAPDKIAFSTTTNGKPSLASDRESGHTSRGSLRFNLSHSENVMLLGVAFGQEIGVDVEVAKPGFDVLPLAQTQFTEAECARLCLLGGAERVGEFYRLWTRHEAIAKATGAGIASPRPATEGCEVLQFDFQSGTQNIVCAVARVR